MQESKKANTIVLGFCWQHYNTSHTTTHATSQKTLTTRPPSFTAQQQSLHFFLPTPGLIAGVQAQLKRSRNCWDIRSWLVRRINQKNQRFHICKIAPIRIEQSSWSQFSIRYNYLCLQLCKKLLNEYFFNLIWSIWSWHNKFLFYSGPVKKH